MSSKQIEEKQQLIKNTKQRDYKRYGWKNVAIKIKENDLIFLTDS